MAVAVALVCCSRSFAAEGSFEPNDSPSTAYGPLALNQSYSAVTETRADRDYYYFYVTAPGESQVSLTVANRGGGGKIAGVSALLYDNSETPFSSLEYLTAGEARTISVTLKPQRYVIEIMPSEGAGDSYDLTIGGAEGAIGPYGVIASRCARSESLVSGAERALSRAEGKQQRAVARLQRSRYSGRDARRRARALLQRARSLVRVRKREAKSAKRSRGPWCSISE